MIKEYCKVCENNHFNNYACSKCGVKFSSVYPTFLYGSALSVSFGRKIKYCPMCGHKFKPLKDSKYE